MVRKIIVVCLLLIGSAKAGDIVTIPPGRADQVRSGNAFQQVTGLPASFNLSGNGDAGDGSTALTNVNLTQRDFQFRMNHILGGTNGSQIHTDGTITFMTHAQLVYHVSALYHVTQPFWTSDPPKIEVDANLIDLVNGPTTIASSSTSDGSDASFSVDSFGLYRVLNESHLYAVDFFAGMNAVSAGSGAGAKATLDWHFSLYGDFNDDGSVGFDDLLNLVQHWGANGAASTYTNGDMNQDGNTGFADLLLLAQHYGESFPASGGAVAVVPEPAVLMVVVGLLAVCRRETNVRPAASRDN